MKDGTCPRCRKLQVRRKHNGLKADRWRITGSSWNQETGDEGADVVTYLCVNCGYFENYLIDRDLLSQAARIWTRIIKS